MEKHSFHKYFLALNFVCVCVCGGGGGGGRVDKLQHLSPVICVQTTFQRFNINSRHLGRQIVKTYFQMSGS